MGKIKYNKKIIPFQRYRVDDNFKIPKFEIFVFIILIIQFIFMIYNIVLLIIL